MLISLMHRPHERCNRGLTPASDKCSQTSAAIITGAAGAKQMRTDAAQALRITAQKNRGHSEGSH